MSLSKSKPLPPSATPADSQGHEIAQQLVARLEQDWHDGKPIDAAALLSQFPGLQEQKHAVLEVAYEEYCLRREAGQEIDLEAFCARFPAFHRSLQRLIAVDHYIQRFPGQFSGGAEPHWPAAGETFLRMQLLRELGRGAFGRVFLAEELELGHRKVVVKLSRQGSDEAQILGTMQHRNIVPVLSVQQDPASGLTAICMPFLGTVTLADVLAQLYESGQKPQSGTEITAALRGRESHERGLPSLPEPRFPAEYGDAAVLVAQQLADALAFSHARGVVHCDVKPSNVLLTHDGTPMLLDFNLSARREASLVLKGGTLPYMSPEQIQRMLLNDDSGPEMDGRTDVFSLGVVCYEMLCGKLPFGVVSTTEPFEHLAFDLLARQEAGPAPVRLANPQVDPALAMLLADCLAFHAKDRPTAAELCTSLQNLRRRPARLRRALRRHRLAIAAGAVLAVVGALAAARWWMSLPPYFDRQLAAGAAAFQRSDCERAVQHLDEALGARPDSTQALLLRGRAHSRLGNKRLALQDYLTARKLGSSAALEAYTGECFSDLGYHDQAIGCYRQAIQQGLVSAGVFNDLGFSYLQSGKLEEARASLDAALARDKGLQAAYYNRAIVRLSAALRSSSPVPQAALDDAQTALALGPETGHLHVLIARLLCRLNRNDPQDRALALTHLQKAIQLGYQPATIRKDLFFKDLRHSPEFQQLCATPPAMKRGASPRLIVDPVFGQ